MPFTIDAGKHNLTQPVKAFAGAIKREGGRATAFGLYGGLCAAAFQPHMLAMASGNSEQVSAAVIALAGTVGGGMLVNLAQKLVAAPTTRRSDGDERQTALAKLIEVEAKRDSRVADALDAMLSKLGAVEQAEREVRAEDKAWFVETLRAELRDLGSSLTIDSGGGAVVTGCVRVAAGGVFVGRDQYNVTHIYGRDNTDWARLYLAALRRKCQRLPLGDMGERPDAEDQRHVLSLDQVYVALNLRGQQVERDDRDDVLSRALQREGGEATPALAVVARSDRVVLHGTPGSGKSAFLKKVVADLCGDQLIEHEDPDRPPTLNAALRPLRNAFPIMVELRKLAQRLKALDGDLRGKTRERQDQLLLTALWQQWESDLDELRVRQFGPGLEAKLQDPNLTALLVFDGLDEVAPEMRAWANRTVLAALRAYANPRAVVTVRTRSLASCILADFDAHELLPFDDRQIAQFARAWYAGQAPHRLAEGEAKRLGEHFAEAALDPQLASAELVSNPLLLTVMAIVHQSQAQLPKERAKLIDKAVDVMLDNWQKRKRDAISDELRQMLEDRVRVQAELRKLAYLAHSTQAMDAGARQATKAAPADLTGAMIVRQLMTSEYKVSKALAQDFLDYVDEFAGLLVGGGGESDRDKQVYTFPHRTFQEFLAGRHLLLCEDETPLDLFTAKAAEGDYWERAAQLGAEAQYYLSDARNKLRELVYMLCPTDVQDTPADWRGVLWSANIAAINKGWIANDSSAAAAKLKGGEAYLTRARDHLLTIMRGRKLPAVERVGAGRALARLGDSRPEVMTVEAVTLVDVLASDFLAGDDKETRTIAQPFFISHYPITNAQFGQFVSDGGYTKAEYAEWWREAAELGWWQAGRGYKGRYDNDFRDGPERYRDEAFALDNHPVVGVSWHEALAFTRWLNARISPPVILGQAQVEGLGEGFSFRLPTEWEWERAARGVDGRVYPWGDDPKPDLANYDETRIGATGAVGCFPWEDHWPNDCEDLCGNVWEWTLSRYQAKDEADAVDTGGNDYRVLRGGSWVFSVNYLRAAYRRSYLPYDAFNLIGFRVVWGCAPIP